MWNLQGLGLPPAPHPPTHPGGQPAQPHLDIICFVANPGAHHKLKACGYTRGGLVERGQGEQLQQPCCGGHGCSTRRSRMMELNSVDPKEGRD